MPQVALCHRSELAPLAKSKPAAMPMQWKIAKNFRPAPHKHRDPLRGPSYWFFTVGLVEEQVLWVEVSHLAMRKVIRMAMGPMGTHKYFEKVLKLLEEHKNLRGNDGVFNQLNYLIPCYCAWPHPA